MKYGKISKLGVLFIFLLCGSMSLFLWYEILYDLLLILLLFMTAFSIGQMCFKAHGSIFETTMMQTALGLGSIGIFVYFVLLFGMGNKYLYLCILIIPSAIWLIRFLKKGSNRKLVMGVYKNSCLDWKIMLGAIMILLVFTFYMLYAAAPISTYDTLTKHLPITVYAANNGKWYYNVLESIVYGETMVLQYTYTTIFYSLGAYKALVLFNVVLYFVTFFAVQHFMINIYEKSNKLILAAIFFSTPMFFTYTTCFYLEILPLYFLFSALVVAGKKNIEDVWLNIVSIAFLGGCALFTKLTILQTVCIIGAGLLLQCLCYAIRNKILNQWIKKVCCCAMTITIPWIVSVINIWYWTGNPFFPQYNALFKSPYYLSDANFIDPFFANKLTLSLNSLLSIVFHTSKNGGGDRELGFYLLLCLLIPVVIIVIKKDKRKKILFWGCMPFISYIACTFTTYNVRYYMSVWILFAVIITASLSMILQSCNINIRECAIFLIILFVMIPNLRYIKIFYQVEQKIMKNENLIEQLEVEFLEKEIPKGKRVFDLGDLDQFKGSYDGYFASSNWHSTYFLAKWDSGEIAAKDYLYSFDYIVYEKNLKDIHHYPQVDKLLEYFLEHQSEFEKISENDTYAAYRVINVQHENSILNHEIGDFYARIPLKQVY